MTKVLLELKNTTGYTLLLRKASKNVHWMPPPHTFLHDDGSAASELQSGSDHFTVNLVYEIKDEPSYDNRDFAVRMTWNGKHFTFQTSAPEGHQIEADQSRLNDAPAAVILYN